MHVWAQFTATSAFLLAAVAVSTGLLLWRAQRQLGRSKTSEPAAWERPAAPASRAAYTSGKPPAVERWEVEMHDLARELMAQIDTKLGLLTQLTRAAEEQANRLEQLLARSGQTARIVPAAVVEPARDLKRPASLAVPLRHLATPDEAAQPRATANLSQADGLRASVGAIRTAVSEMPAAATTTIERPTATIYALADSGFDPPAIAERVGTPVGEVQLILSLRAVE